MFKYLVNYIILKAKSYSTNYVLSEKSKPQCLKKIKLSKGYGELNESLNFCFNQNFTTVKNFHILLAFCKKLENQKISLVSIDEEVILDFLFISTIKKSQATAHRYRNTVLAFVNHHKKINDKNIIAIKSYKSHQEKSLSKYSILSKKEIKILFENIKILPNHQDSVRDAFILDILIKTGIRVSELLHIKKYELTFEFEYCYISIKGKNNLYRIVAIAVEPHKEKIKHVMNSRGIWLFMNGQKQMDRGYIYKLISKLLKFSNIVKNKSGPHLLRHTFASHLYEKEKDLILVQEALGHQSISMTTKYIHLNIEALKKAAEAFDDVSCLSFVHS